VVADFIGRHTRLSGRCREVLREQRRHLVRGLLGQPVRGAVEFGEAIGPGDVVPAQLGRGPRDKPVAVTPGGMSGRARPGVPPIAAGGDGCAIILRWL